MTYRTVAFITAIITLVLGVGYLFFGGLVVGRWQIQPTESVVLLGRRMGALYLGLSIILFLARSVPVSAARMALCTGGTVIGSLLAVLGLYEYSAGHAGSAILASVVLETLVAVGFIWVLFTDRRRMAAGSPPDKGGVRQEPLLESDKRY
jgi:hypothetical protein